ncbi:MAG TPA: S9 family peptidase [Candidatus Enterenecus stercoripullorum]|nr:S9 family peptidase [Candidatus Enterenecus stercoripullorum]
MKKPVEIRDFLSFRFISHPTWSPGGALCAFVVQQAEEADNQYTADLYLYEADSQKVRRLTALGDAKTYCWTNQSTVLFPAARDKADREAIQAGELRTVYYEINPHGGEAVKAFTLPITATSLTQLEDGRFVVSAIHDLNYPELDGLSGEERAKALKNYLHPSAEVFDELPFWGNGMGYTSGKRSRLYLYDRERDKLTPITKPGWDASLSHAALGKLVFRGGPWKGVAPFYDGLYVYDLSTKKTTRIIKPGRMKTGPAVLLDENKLLLAATYGENYGTEEYCQFFIADIPTGKLTRLADYEASIGYSTVGSDARLGGGRGCKLDGNQFWFISTVGDQANLMSVTPEGILTTHYARGGSVDSFDVKDGNIIFAGFQGQGLTELFDGDGNQLTHFNDHYLATHDISAPICHSFTASDGFEIHGWAVKPHGYRKGKKYPAILHIHGGPRTVFGDVFHHEMQVWVSAGYFVFYCNPRGSDGRGNEFGDISGKYGTVDYQNLMDFMDEMLQTYPQVDPKRVAVTGGSYGGFMTNWVIGHTNRFAAACSQRSIANWVSFEHTTDIGYFFTPSQIGADTRTDVEKLWRHSPLKYAPNAKTPTLFIHSEQDYRCWMSEGLSMFSALKRNGTETRLVLFHGENHELSRSGKPQNRIRRMEEILRWFDQHLQ